MSVLLYRTAEEGNVSNDNDNVDNFYDGLATASGAIATENTRTEWASTKHIDWEDKPLTKSYTHRDNTTASASYVSTSWATVTHGGAGSSEVTGINQAIRVGDVVRANFNFITNPSADELDSALGKDYFWVSLEYQYNSGAGDVWATLGHYTRYSFDIMRAASGFHDPNAGYRRSGMTFIYISTYIGTIKGVRARVKMEDGDCALNMGHWGIQLRVIGA